MRRSALLIVLAAGLLVGACARLPASQTVGDLRVTVSTEPTPARVGDSLVKATITTKGGAPFSPSRVTFHYYPFVYRDKDSLASPDEAVRVVEPKAGPDGHAAKLNFEKPGPWRVTLKITRPDAPPAIVTFTFDVRA